jgi:hypothetical protein
LRGGASFFEIEVTEMTAAMYLTRAIERVRTILSEPDNVVLDPAHYVELGEAAETVGVLVAEERRDSCRVCFAGAAVLSAIDHLPNFAHTYSRQLATSNINRLPVIAELADAARDLGIQENERYSYGDVAVLTQALVDGRVDEVCDRALQRVEEEAPAHA